MGGLKREALLGSGLLNVPDVADAPFLVVELERSVKVDVALGLENSVDGERAVHDDPSAGFEHRCGAREETEQPIELRATAEEIEQIYDQKLSQPNLSQ